MIDPYQEVCVHSEHDHLQTFIDRGAWVREAIAKTAEFFKALGIPATLREIGISEDKLEKMAKSAVDNGCGSVGTFRSLSYEDVLGLYKASP